MMAQNTVPFLPRVNFGRRLEPVGDVVLHGAGQSPDAFQEYYKVMEEDSKPLLYMTYMGLREDVTGYFQRLLRELDSYAPHQLLPQIGLMMTGGADEHHHPEQHYEQQVAEGHYDDQLEALCVGLHSLARPVYLRIGFEFNGPWFGYQPEPYRAAWLRIVEALRRNGLDDVATVWCYYPSPSRREHPNGVDRDFLAYYPGDAYVDWWAIDLFSVENLTAGNTAAFLADAQRHGFPVMIGESTPKGVGGMEGGEQTWHAWFVPYFDLIRTQPVVKAFCYISWDWTEYPVWRDWGDARIWVNRRILDLYREELRSPHYQHASLSP